MKKQVLPKGFLANGIHCGMKRKRKDLSLIYSEEPCKVAALFTKNIVKAAPVAVCQEQLKKNVPVRALLINSGNANCMTGNRGIKDARKTISATAKLLNLSPDEVLISSTGVIGKYMPMKTLLKGIPDVVKGLSVYGVVSAADGIVTTDRFHKITARTFKVGGKKIRMVGIAKGAGMIKPGMATMLCYIVTDAEISKSAAKQALSLTTDETFNAITVDGDMSTNDTVMLLANGKAGNDEIDEKSKDFEIFRKNLKLLCKNLAGMIVMDGEGATKFFKVKVKSARRKSDAKKIADAVANSLLVKCAVLGSDPNWGRIGSSAGASGVPFDPDIMEIILDGVTYYKNGKAAEPKGKKAASVFKKKYVQITVDLHQGQEETVVYSCDISKKYITLNAHYTT